MAEKTTDISLRQQDPFNFFDRFADEMGRVFDDFGLGHGLAPRFRNAGAPEPRGWAPDIEVHQRGNDLIVRADLPGMRKPDISVDVSEDAITISGERRREASSEHEGVYRSERSYGSFYRTIPLPEGAITDQAKASFRDGVLEITMPCPPQSTRSRRLEISETAEQKSEQKSEQKK